jgi:hypothetical protein
MNKELKQEPGNSNLICCPLTLVASNTMKEEAVRVLLLFRAIVMLRTQWIRSYKEQLFSEVLRLKG